MKRILLAALASSVIAGGLSVAFAQPGVQQKATAAPLEELKIPARKQQAPVPALLQSRANTSQPGQRRPARREPMEGAGIGPV